MKKFSIIMPVYNGEKYITTSINNILNQTFCNFELILVNDGSNDNTLIKLSSFINLDNIKIVSYDENKGVSFARNIGVENSEGEFLLFLDSDDFLEYNCLNKLNIILESEDFDLISYGFIKTFKNRVINYSNIKYDNVKFTNLDFLENYFTRKIPQCMCSFICKKKIITQNNILFSEDIYFAEDQEFQIKCMHYSKKIFYTSYPFFKYNLQEASVMNSSFSVKRLTVINAFMNVSELFKNDKRLNKLFINYFFYNYYGLIKFLLKSNVDMSLIKENFKIIIYKDIRPYLLIDKLSIIVNSLFFIEKNLPFLFIKIIKKLP